MTVPRPVGRPAAPASAVTELAMELWVGVDETFRRVGTRLWEAALCLGDWGVLADCHALNENRRAIRTICRRMAGRAEALT